MFDVLSLRSLYNVDYIGKQRDSYIWSEKQDNPDALATVSFIFKNGTISYISSNLLKEMQNAYRVNEKGLLKLRKICDGVLFLDRDEEHYLIVLEVKSGFKDVKSKAILQIPTSYVKIKSILNDFLNYKDGEYKELGLIISYPYVKYAQTDSENNHVVIDNKLAMIGDKNEIVTSKYIKSLQNSGEAIFDGHDFEFDELKGVKPKLYFEKLRVKHCPVEHKSVSVEIDLDGVVKS